MNNSAIFSIPRSFCSRCGEQLQPGANFCPRCAMPANPQQLFNDFPGATNPSPTRKVGLLLTLGILVMPYIFSWFTLRKGHSNLSRTVSFIWLGVLVLSPLISQEPRERHAASNENASLSTTLPKATSTESAKQAAAKSPPVAAWATQESRDILGAFFIQPYLRPWLKDPDSLQDFKVVNARPNKKLPDSYEVTVFYRARNSFGALVPEQRTVTMVYNPKDANHPWVMMP